MHSNKTPNPAPELLRVDEVAEALRVSRSTAYRIVSSGALDPRVHVGDRGSTRITRDALNVYISRNNATIKEAS